MGCNCGKPKCDGHCGVSPAVLQINNPSECVLFHRVEVPASMGDSTTNPPKPGAYRNTLLYYKADGEAFLYSSDGIPTKITGVANDYACLENKPQINGVTLEGNKSLADIGVTNAINNALEPYTPTSELAEVAFTGDYNDLENTPPKTFARFYMWPPLEGNAAPMYHDYGRTDQVTLAQFTDAIASGPVQIYMEHDGHTFWIYYVDQLDAFIPDPPMVIGTLDVSFGLRSQNQDELGVRRFYWQEGDTAPIYDSYNPNQSDWNQTSPTRSSYIKNKPNLATVATSGSYNDLSDKPTIPAAQVNSDWNASSGVAQILNKPTLAAVATSGNYDDLSNKPTIPAAQVNSDWNAASGVAQILNKPSLATVATSGSYNDLSDKPTIPTVPSVVQAVGTSTTSVMSQNAVTGLIYYDPSTRGTISIGTTNGYEVTGGIQIGGGALAPEDYSIAIGYNARGSDGGYPYKGIAIGANAYVWSEGGVAIGADTNIQAGHSVAIGDKSYVGSLDNEYVVSVGRPSNVSNPFTRRIINVTDPINAQDAATKNYVDTVVGNIETILQTLNSGTGAQ